MDRYNLNDGSTAEVLAELERLRADRATRTPDRAEAYAAAIERIRAGADWVRIGDQAWRVIDWAEA